MNQPRAADAAHGSPFAVEGAPRRVNGPVHVIRCPLHLVYRQEQRCVRTRLGNRVNRTSGVAERRRVTPLVERLLLCRVANRALAPVSKLAALEWAKGDA